MNDFIGSLNPLSLGQMVTLLITLLVLLYAIRIPLKRRYHWIYIIFVADLAVMAGIVAVAQLDKSAEIFFPKIWWAWFLGAPLQLALFYHFALDFISHKRGGFQRYTLWGAYAFLFIWWGMLLWNPDLLLTQPKRIPVGWVVSPGILTPYLFPFGISLPSTTVGLLISAALAKHYRSVKSAFTKGRTKYFLIGAILLVAGYVSLSIAIYIGGISLLPFFSISSVATLLVGLRKYGFFAVTPVTEAPSKQSLIYNLSQGPYLVTETTPNYSFEVFSNFTLNGYQGLCISRLSTEDIREPYLLKSTPILWLSEEKNETAITPTDLNGLWLSVKAFVYAAEHPVVLLHGIEYLISVNGFRPILRLIVRLNDLNSQKKYFLFIASSEGGLTERQRQQLFSHCPALHQMDASGIKKESATPAVKLKQEIEPLLQSNSTFQSGEQTEKTNRHLLFKHDASEKVFLYLARLFLKDFAADHLYIDVAGWQTVSEVAKQVMIPTSTVYGRSGRPGPALAELMERGLVETRWLTGTRGRGGKAMKVRINYGNPYVKEELDQLARQP